MTAASSGFPTHHFLQARDYWIASIPLWILSAFLAVTILCGSIENYHARLRQQAAAEHFWNEMVFSTPLEGRGENGECFIFAIHLRNLIQVRTGEEAQFTFVRWTDLDPNSGPTVHVYTQFVALHQLWVVDNLGHFAKFKPETKPEQWMQQLGPKGYHYHIIGDIHALVADAQGSM